MDLLLFLETECPAQFGKELRPPVERRADRVEARDITSHRTQDAMQFFERFSDCRILRRFSQKSLGCPRYAKATVVQIPIGKIEREALIGSVRAIIQYLLSQAPDSCHASVSFRNPPTLVRFKPEAKPLSSLINSGSQVAALLPAERTQLRQHVGFAEQIA